MKKPLSFHLKALISVLLLSACTSQPMPGNQPSSQSLPASPAASTAPAKFAEPMESAPAAAFLPAGSGFTIEGDESDSDGGFAVSNAGDLNKDGFDDLIIGAPHQDDFSHAQAGKCYVVFGSASLSKTERIKLASLSGQDGFKITGEAGDQAGYSVSGAGDVNGDGYADLVIGAPAARFRKGGSYVVFGSAMLGKGGSLSLSDLNESTGFKLTGSQLDRAGESVSGAGDLNKDGFADLVIGAPSEPGTSGTSYVLYGSEDPGSDSYRLDLSKLTFFNGFSLRDVTDAARFGQSVSQAGDVNQDGFDDLIIGAPYTDDQAGASHVVFGSFFVSKGIPFTLPSFSSPHLKISGTASEMAGASVSGAGDVNRDGFADLIISAPGANGQSGSSYVVFGSAQLDHMSQLDLKSLSGHDGFKITGRAGSNPPLINSAGVMSGPSVSSAGDFNHDGFGDLIIGQSGGPYYVVFGSSDLGSTGSLALSTLDGSNGFMIEGLMGKSGATVSSAGDINHDGFDDLIIGSLYAYTRSYDLVSSSYVLLGTQAPFPSVLPLYQMVPLS